MTMEEMIERLFSANLPTNNSTILEIGAADGRGTTKLIFDFCKEKNIECVIESYEGSSFLADKAREFWKKENRVTIHDRFFCNKEDIYEKVLPNLFTEASLTADHYLKEYTSTCETGKFVDTVPFSPDIVFIDCWRFCHAAIVQKCKDLFSKDTIFIMEDDIPQYGETKILQKYFTLNNLKKYDGVFSHGTWNFVTFTL